eukprot:6204422-Pleurochrysis_carterae.AAC.3
MLEIVAAGACGALSARALTAHRQPTAPRRQRAHLSADSRLAAARRSSVRAPFDRDVRKPRGTMSCAASKRRRAQVLCVAQAHIAFRWWRAHFLCTPRKPIHGCSSIKQPPAPERNPSFAECTAEQSESASIPSVRNACDSKLCVSSSQCAPPWAEAHTPASGSAPVLTCVTDAASGESRLAICTECVRSPALKLIAEPCASSDESRKVRKPHSEPNGGTAPGKHAVTLHTSASVANRTDLKPPARRSAFESILAAAEITERTNSSPGRTLSSMAFAPLARVAPRTCADSLEVRVGAWVVASYCAPLSSRSDKSCMCVLLSSSRGGSRSGLELDALSAT